MDVHTPVGKKQGTDAPAKCERNGDAEHCHEE